MRIFSILALSLYILPLCFSPARAGDILRIGSNIWPGYEPLFLAREISGWSRSGPIRLVEYPSASAVLRAFRNRAIEAAALTLDEALLLRQDNIPIRIILILDVSDGGDVILATPPISSIRQLSGKKVGVEGGALGAFVITRALEINGMTVKDIRVVQLDITTHEKAYLEKKIDAVVTFEPVRSRLIASGAVEIFSSRQMPGEIMDVLVVREDALVDNAQSLRALTRGWFRALELIRSRDEKAAAIMSRRMKLTTEQTMKSFEGIKLPTLEENKKILSGPNPQLKARMLEMGRVMLNHSLVKGEMTVEGIADGTYLP